ncbi:uncharacterized protein TNCV_2340461 [Trichonephila clavipes]|nr:uncharacterized protein TNCV_2340461 [Trichonephila clavipes]
MTDGTYSHLRIVCMLSPVQSNCDAHDIIANGQRRISNTTSPCRLLHIPVVLNDFHRRETTLLRTTTGVLLALCQDEFRGPRYDYVRQVALENNNKRTFEEGRKITDVAREFGIAHSVVSRLWKSFKTTGMCSRRHGGGRVRNTTPAEDRYIVLYQQKGTDAPQLSRWQISFLLPQESRSPEKLLPDV